MNNFAMPNTRTNPPNTAAPNRYTRRIAALTIAATAALAGAFQVDAANSGTTIDDIDTLTEQSVAEFEGRLIDLSKDWEEAEACWVDEVGHASCFRTEEQMDRALDAAGKAISATSPAPAAEQRAGARAAQCSSSLRLYRNNSYGGSVLYLSQRYYWINLSAYGFDNVVSSYRVGGCSTTFRSGTGGSGTTYWGATWAWASRSSMSGWDNVLSSVRIS